MCRGGGEYCEVLEHLLVHTSQGHELVHTSQGPGLQDLYTLHTLHTCGGDGNPPDMAKEHCLGPSLAL